MAAALVHSFEAVDREIMTRCRMEGTKGGATGLVVLRIGARRFGWEYGTAVMNRSAQTTSEVESTALQRLSCTQATSCLRALQDTRVVISRSPRSASTVPEGLAPTHAGNQLYAAHCGDTRAVMSRNGEALRLTEDHKPNLPRERKRVEVRCKLVSVGLSARRSAAMVSGRNLHRGAQQ